jgi:hypothetical protein
VYLAGERWELFQTKPESGKLDKIGAVRITSVGEKESIGDLVDGTAVQGAVARFDKPAKNDD